MTLPPYADLLGVTITHADGLAPRLTMPFARSVSGRPGFLHGGAIGGLLEIAAIAAVQGALDDDAVIVKPITLTVDYMRGGRDRDTHAQGVIRRLGTRVANVDATAWQDDPDRPIAAARLTLLLRR